MQNKAKALKVLRSRLYEAQRAAEQAARASMRKEQVPVNQHLVQCSTLSRLQSILTLPPAFYALMTRRWGLESETNAFARTISRRTG